MVGAHCPGGPVIAVGGGEGMVMVEDAAEPFPLPCPEVEQDMELP